MLADEVTGVRHAIDFLNPRKRPVPPSNRRRTVIAAASALGVAAVLAAAVWAGQRHLDSQIADLKTQAVALDKAVDTAKKLMVKADAVREFTDGDVTWLDEMRELAQRIPDADHLKLDDVGFGADLKRGGSLTLKGHVTSSDVIADFEDSLRFDGNVVAGRYGTIDRNQREYPYVLDTTVVVVPDVYDQGRSRGRPYREQLRKQAAESKSTAAVSIQGASAEQTKLVPPKDASPEKAPASQESTPETSPSDAAKSETTGSKTS